MARALDDPKRLLTVLNRSALQRTDPPVYQAIKGLIDTASSLVVRTAVIPPITGAMAPFATPLPASEEQLQEQLRRMREAMRIITVRAGLSTENQRLVEDLLKEPGA
jgi:hypothetical protein